MALVDSPDGPGGVILGCGSIRHTCGEVAVSVALGATWLTVPVGLSGTSSFEEIGFLNRDSCLVITVLFRAISDEGHKLFVFHECNFCPVGSEYSFRRDVD
jgi:hypothetical protein